MPNVRMNLLKNNSVSAANRQSLLTDTVSHRTEPQAVFMVENDQ